MSNVYIASPWFTPEQDERLQFVKSVFDKQGVEYFSPKDVFVCPPEADRETRESTFEGNIAAIDDAEYVFAITDGKDMGTIWEAGYAYGVGVPVIYYCETLSEGSPFNLMLAQSAYNIITSRDELRNFDLRPGEVGYNEYSGSIE